MKKFSCKEIVMSSVKEADKNFSLFWKRNEKDTDILMQYCEVLDEAIEKFGASVFDVSVDWDLMTVKITIQCKKITLGHMSRGFLGLIDRSIRFDVERGEEDELSFTFVFPSLWERNCPGLDFLLS